MPRLLFRALLFVAYNIVVVGLLLLVLEGPSSLSHVARDLVRSRPVAERLHTTFDPDLGWINRPNVYIKDMYGPGVYLRTNAQRFRNNDPIAVPVPAGKVRVICSGDSFTFGYGVDNDHTWCQVLAHLDPRLEPVNMGQGGYGADQIYLWFKRDGAALAHDVHVVAVVSVDFDRMLLSHFLGYDKPVLDVDRGALVVRNVPLREPSVFRLLWNRSLPTLQQLHTVQVLQRWLRHDTSDTERRGIEAHFQQIVASVLGDLVRLNQAQHSAMVLVYLPTRRDYAEDTSDFWREFLVAETSRRQIPFVDLIQELRALPAEEFARLFIPEESVTYVGAAGHYTEAGNAAVAAAVHRHLAPLISSAGPIARESESR